MRPVTGIEVQGASTCGSRCEAHRDSAMHLVIARGSMRQVVFTLDEGWR